MGWERPLVAGHSWGWHVALTLGDRVGGVLAIDPMGAVGDLGMPTYEERLKSRMSPEDAARYDELESRYESPGLTEAETLERGQLYLPAMFADPRNMERLSPYEAALPAIRVPLGALSGAESPMPLEVSTDITDRVPGAWTEVVPGAGHVIWLEHPDAVAEGLARLLR